VGQLCGKIGGKIMKKVGIRDLTKEDKLDIEKYGEEHPNLCCNWIDDRYCNKILFKNIPIKSVPTIREHSTYLDCSDVIGTDPREATKQTSSSKTFYKTAMNPMEALKKAIMEQVSCDITPDGELFSKADAINWFEANIATDPNFAYRLDEEFVSDFKRKSKDFLSYDDLRKNYDRIATECELLKKENVHLKAENCILKKKIEETKSYQSEKELFRALAVKIVEDAAATGIKPPNIPDTIYAIAMCLDIKIYPKKGDTKTNYNKENKNVRFYYGTIEGYIRGIVEKGKGGRITEETDKYRKKLCEPVKNKNYDSFRQNFIGLISKSHKNLFFIG
jgi:hypothetical protein